MQLEVLTTPALARLLGTVVLAALITAPFMARSRSTVMLVMTRLGGRQITTLVMPVSVKATPIMTLVITTLVITGDGMATVVVAVMPWSDIYRITLPLIVPSRIMAVITRITVAIAVAIDRTTG